MDALLAKHQMDQLQMTNEDIYWTFRTAFKYGGSFYEQLGLAAIKADPANKQRILLAFPELIDSYGPQTNWHISLRTKP